MTKIIDIVMSKSDEGTQSAVEKWFKQPGDRLKIHEPLLEIVTDKVSVEIPAPATGILKEIIAAEGQEIEPGDLLGKMEEVEMDKISGPSATSKKEEAVAVNKKSSPRLSPAVRKLVKQHNIDISQMQGTGKGGRITHQDIENFLQSSDSKDMGKKVPHSHMRRSIAAHMVESMLKTAPHVTAMFEADLSSIVKHRAQNKEAFAQQSVKLTYTAYFVIATVKALQEVPEVNSRWHEKELEIFSDCNIGIATALPDGLIVPVIAKAQTLDLMSVAKALQDMVGKAREGKLDPQQVKNGTFTITNHGVSGSLMATPIINQPQSAILGIGKMEKRLVIVTKDGSDSMEIKPMAYITLTIDHRALDGFKANIFLSKFVDVLANWK